MTNNEVELSAEEQAEVEAVLKRDTQDGSGDLPELPESDFAEDSE